MTRVRGFLTPLVVGVLAAVMLTGPFANQAAAGGSVNAGARVGFQAYHSWGPCTQQPGSCGTYGYTVWTDPGTWDEYLDSYVYPNKWLFGKRRVVDCIELVQTYPVTWSITPWMDVFSPNGTQVYSWGGANLPWGGGVICAQGSSAWTFERTTYQEYVDKGGAWIRYWTTITTQATSDWQTSGWFVQDTARLP